MRISGTLGIGTGTLLASAALIAACSGKSVDLGGKDRLSGDGGPGSGGNGAGGGANLREGGLPGEGGLVPDPPGITRTSKLDLLLMVDNSISMADKQKILKDTIPDLVNRLTSAGSGVEDIHVGIITSSLGDHGDHNTCNGADGTGDVTQEEQDDHGRLVTTRPRASTLGLPDVITWDRSQSAATLTQQMQSAVTAVGEFGCGLEAQLEAVYRFLADPNPPLDVTSAPCPGTTAAQRQPCATPTGRDDALLAQRAKFLRPDSAVGIVMLTDENDCSIRDTQQFFYAARQDIVLPQGSSACAQNPNDKCCYSCAAAPPAGCTTDPSCSNQPAPNQGAINLRCFNEKQRFGLDFLYPIERYRTAFTRTRLCTSRVDLVPSADCPDADLDGHCFRSPEARFGTPPWSMCSASSACRGRTSPRTAARRARSSSRRPSRWRPTTRGGSSWATRRRHRPHSPWTGSWSSHALPAAETTRPARQSRARTVRTTPSTAMTGRTSRTMI